MIQDDNIIYRGEVALDFLDLPQYVDPATGISLEAKNPQYKDYIEGENSENSTEEGDGFFSTTANIWRQANIQGHSVNLNKKLQEYSDSEGKWLPEIEQAKAYLENKQEIRRLLRELYLNANNWSNEQKQATQQLIEYIRQLNDILEFGVNNGTNQVTGLRTLARTNPYLRDIFYDTTYFDDTKSNALSQDGAKQYFSIKDRLKIRMYDWLSGTYTGDVDPRNNLSHYISEGGVNSIFGVIPGPTNELLNYLWDLKNLESSLDAQILELGDALRIANAREENKRAEISNKINTIKKGNLLFDPTKISPAFKRKYEHYKDEGLSFNNLESWVYSIPELGSSYAEVGAMLGSIGASALLNSMAKAALATSTGGVAPLLYAATEAAVLYGIQDYMRESETKSEIFDASAARALLNINENNIPLNSIVEQYKPLLKEKGYPVESMTDQEIFNLSLVEPEKLQTQFEAGLTPDKVLAYNNIKETVLDEANQEVIKLTNAALSLPDFVVNMFTFSYGGLYLKRAYGMSTLRLGTNINSSSPLNQTIRRAYDTPYDPIPKTGKLALLQQRANLLIDRTIVKNFDKIVKNPMTRVSANRALKSLAETGKKMGLSYFNERNEEGIQNIVSNRYQSGDYDNVSNYSLLDGLAHDMLLGVEANLAYFGIHPDESLNTDKDLRNAMDVGGFTGMFLTGIYGALSSRSLYKQIMTDLKLRGLVSDRYGDAERDNKVEAFVKANNANGKNFRRIRESLESLKLHKPEGVTDEMIDNDIELADRVSYWLHNKTFRRTADRVGAKKGSRERTMMIQNLIDIQDRANEQGKTTTDVAKQLEDLIQELLNGSNKDFDFALGREYASYVNRKRNALRSRFGKRGKPEELQQIEKLLQEASELEQAVFDIETSGIDLENIAKATLKHRARLAVIKAEQERLSSLWSKDPVSYSEYKQNILNLYIQLRAYKLLKQLQQEIANRKSDLLRLAKEKHLDVNLEGISGISSYIDQFLKQNKKLVDELLTRYRQAYPDTTEDLFLEIASNQYSIPRQEEFDNLILSRAVNAGAYNDLLNHLSAYITGAYMGDMRLYNHTFENLTAEELAEITITPQEYNDRYALSESENEMDEAADNLDLAKRLAIRVIERDIARRMSKANQAAREILEDYGTPADLPVVESADEQVESPTLDNGQEEEQADTGYTNGQTESGTRADVDTSAMQETQGSQQDEKSKLELEIEQLEEQLGQTLLTPEQEILNEEELLEYEPQIPVEQVREEVENNIADSDSELDLIRIKEELAEEVGDEFNERRQESAAETPRPDNVNEAAEELRTEEPTSLLTPQETVPVTEVEIPPTDNSAVIPPAENELINDIPSNEELFVDPVTGLLMHDPSGMHDVRNSNPIEDAFLQTQNEFEAATDEYIVGPALFLKQTANSDQINPTETTAKQKRRYIASTFFYQPTSDEVMPILNYGKTVLFTTKDGKKATRQPGRVLAEMLSIPGWLKSIDDAYYVVTSNIHSMSELEAIDNLAVHLIIEKDGQVYNTALRSITPLLRKELLSTGMSELEVEEQINKLRSFRNQIIKAYSPSYFLGKPLPNTPSKHVKPVNLRSSNGSLNNTVDSHGLPLFRLLSEVEDFGIPNDPLELSDRISNPDETNGIEIGFGAGPFSTNFEPFSILRLDLSGETSVQGRGYAGKLYLIPKEENTPSGNRTLPIMLAEELHLIPGIHSYHDIQLSVNADGTVNEGVIPTTAELIFNLLTGQYPQIPATVRQFILDILANTGSKTSTAGFDAEESNRFNFLVRKQLLTFESLDSKGNVTRRGLVTAEPRRQGMPQLGYQPYVTDLLRLTNDAKKKAIYNISQNIHWNTDKDLLMSTFPLEFVDMLIATYNNYKGKKDANTLFRVLSNELTFSLNDIGYTVKDGKVVRKEGNSPILMSWYITHGKIKTDLGQRAFYAPFVYTDGSRVDSSTVELQEKSKPAQKITTTELVIEERKPNTKDTVTSSNTKPTERSTRKPTIAIAATPENLEKYGLLIPPNMKPPIGLAWGIVQDRNGNYKVTLAPKNRVQGFTSVERGEGSFDRANALKWLEDTLGITPENTDILVVNGIASTLSDSRVYGVMRVVADTLSGLLNPQFIFSNDAGKGIEYHEAFHYVTLLLLDRNERAALYAEYERRHPGELPRTKREVEELLAEEFRAFMLKESNPSIGYRISKFFKAIRNYIQALFGRINVQDTLFNAIAKGKFKNYKLDPLTVSEFHEAYGEGLYYYIPGLTREQVDAMPNITDGNTFYKVIDSLTSTVLTMYKVRSLNDVENLSIHGIFEQLLDRLDQGWIAEENVPLVEDVINNEDVFKKYILRKLRSLSIKELDTLESEENSRLLTETGDNPDNNWDRDQGSHSKKKNVSFRAKLFFYSVPQYQWSFIKHEDGSITKEAEPKFDDIFGFNIAEDFNVVWNKIMNNLWDIDSYQDILARVSRLAKTDPTFYALDQILNDPDNPIDDNTKTQLEVTIKSFDADYTTIQEHGDTAKRTPGISDDNYLDMLAEALKRSIWEVKSSKNLRRIALYPREWSNAFFSSGAVLTSDNGDRYIDKNLINYLNVLRRSISKIITPFTDKKYKGTKPTGDDLELKFQLAKEDFIKICNAISIPFDIPALDRMLDEMADFKTFTGNEDVDKFISFWSKDVSRNNAFSDILQNLVSMSNRTNATLRSRGATFVRSSDRVFNYANYEAAINKMARAYGQVHPSQQENSVVGADGSLMYSISENNYVNDQIRNINLHKHGKLELILKTPYSKRSLLANAANNGAKFKLNSFLMLQVRNDKGRDYFGISPIEDYISKLVLTFNDLLTLPTMSDKKTWYSISGLSLIRDVLKSSRRILASSFSENLSINDTEEISRRFSTPTLNTFANMFLDEFDAVWDYYKHKDYVAKHPEDAVDNYHGKIENGVMQPGGNGGRFRYFSSLRFNGEIYNINHKLAKLETEDTTEAVLNYLKSLKMLLFKTDRFKTILEVDNDSMIFEAMNNFLVGATNRELKQLVSRGIIGYKNGRYQNKLIPHNIFNYYSALIGQNDYNKSQLTQREEDILYSVIGSHIANSMISIIEFEKCFTGDPAYYKHKTMKVTEDSDVNPGTKVTFTVDVGRDVDKTKRLSSVLSTGTNLRTIWDNPEESDTKISVLTLKDNKIGSAYEELLRSIFRNSLLRDLYSRKHPNMDDDSVIKALSNKKDEDAFYNSLTKKEKDYIDKETESSVSPYTFGKDKNGKTDYNKEGSINQSDAAVYIRPALYMRIMKALGNWSPEIEEAYNIMEGEDESWMSDPVKYAKTTAALAQPLKMVYFGDHFRSKTNLNVPVFDKMAMFPLFKALAKADNRLLYDRMNNEKLGTIDMIAFESAVKVGGTPKFKAYKDANNETFDAEGLNKESYNKTGKKGSLPVYTQDISNLRLLLNTEPHEALDRAFGTLAVKICLANLVDDRTYGINKGKEIKGIDIKKLVIAAINALTYKGRIKILKRFFKNSNISNKALSEYLIDQAVGSNMPESFIEGLGLDQNGEFIIPLEATSNRRWVESRLISYIGKTVVDINTKGGAAIQMSSFGFKATGPRKQSAIGYAFNDGKPLSFLREDGSMEVMLSTNFFRHIVPKEYLDSYGRMRQWLIQHNVIGVNAKPIGVGYRIPTLGLSSTFSFVVADVIPDRFGDAVVVPDEFTAMTGSDFDVDKLYIAMLNTDELGNIIQYETDKPAEEQSLEALQNMVIQSYQTVISDSSNMAETRASIDTLTKLLLNEVLPKVQPNVKKEALPAYELLPSFLLSRKEEYTTGKAGIGPFALNSTNHALTLFVHLNMLYSQGNPYRLRQLDEIKGKDGYRILDWLSAMINAHVDVAKDPYIIALNVNSVTYNITNLLLRGGMGRSTFYFLALPVLRRFANTILANNGSYGSVWIGKNGKLREYREEYAQKMKDLINGLEGSEKVLWLRRFNDITNGYELGKVTLYLLTKDNNFISTKYEDTFDENKLSNALTNPNTIEGIYQQLLVINAYLTLSIDAQRLSDLVNRSQIDTKKYGNTIAAMMNFYNSYETFIANNDAFFYIKGLEQLSDQSALRTYFDTTFLSKKLHEAYTLPRDILKRQLISATSCFQDIFTSVMGQLFGVEEIEYSNGKKAMAYEHLSDSRKVNAIAQYISSIIRARIARNIPQLTATDKELRDLFYGTNSMARRWAGLKSYIREHKLELPDLINQDGTFNNPLLDYLQEYPADGIETFVDRVIPVEATMNNDADIDNRLVTAFAELLYHQDEIIRIYANDLAKYAYLTSYDERGRNTFFNLVPNQWKQEVGYISAIKNALSEFKGLNNELAYLLVAESIDDYNTLYFPSISISIARNMWDDEDIVPTLNYQEINYDSDTKRYSGSEKRLFLSIVKIGNSTGRVIDVFTTPEYGIGSRDFVKVVSRIGNHPHVELYQKVGSIGYSNDDGLFVRRRSVFKRIPKLGFTDNGVKVLELLKDSTESSAFDANTFNQTSVYDENSILDAALNSLRDLSKDGLLKIYVSAEADHIGVKISDTVSNLNDQGQEGLDVSTLNVDVMSMDSLDTIIPEQFELIELETSDSVNISIGTGVEELLQEANDAFDIMNSIDSQVTESFNDALESVDVMDMSLFTAEQPVKKTELGSQQQTNTTEMNFADFLSIDSIDMNELVALGLNRKKQCK